MPLEDSLPDDQDFLYRFIPGCSGADFEPPVSTRGPELDEAALERHWREVRKMLGWDRIFETLPPQKERTTPGVTPEIPSDTDWLFRH